MVLILTSFATFIASVLLPSFANISGVGPTNIIPFFLQASANSGLSDKKNESASTIYLDTKKEQKDSSILIENYNSSKSRLQNFW